ncbi:glycosyl hydrolases family 43-domain-containing protein [Apodospora peruviana]|uniref:Glycosyl hydrolases family 43-domain-containing protein n=1 Tax=Apodospora peruviana TaxID=516989 RepID=A0AAE0HSK0_9PEZI|nr:glycosyl hydrolases family 43-domain-containing protein [Apodospora peruviana]
MPQVRNPILPGFNADPSILRVGEDYYIATSTFEWYPGVQIHHSRDLANWELIIRPLNRKAQLDMRGDPDSCGIWAPCLTHDGSNFYLVYTDVKRKDGSFKDTHNYIVSAPTITGPWSDPIYTNSSGFDPSLFHDPDTGKKWFVNMLWDHRRRPLLFEGIALQEFDPVAGKLVGPRKNIYQGTDLALVEGPHLYKRNGYYYLLTAEGGTGYDHAATLARAKDIWGPYETHPDKHVITSKDHPHAALQRAGHADIVDTPDGRTYMVHLTGRPTTQMRRCVLGRETAIQEVIWKEDGWLYLKNNAPVPSLWVDLPAERDDKPYWSTKHYTFEGGELPIDFQWLRTPEPERIFRVADNGLTLIGREAIGSWFEQALVARRQTHFSYDAETVIDFSPEDERQFAGLTAYYCRYNFFYLTVTAHSDGQRELLIMASEASWPVGSLRADMLAEAQSVKIPNEGKVKLRVSVRGKELQFWYAVVGEDGKGEELKKVGPVFDASIVSDECGGHQAHGSFTGAFVGVAASDLNGTAKKAVFDYFEYKPVEHKSDRYEI